VLHDLFGMEFTEVATVVGRTPAAVRQLATRARKHVAAGAPRLEVDVAQHEAAVQAFALASAGGDLAALIGVLDPNVVLTSDGGGQVSAALRPVYSADRVARFVLGIARKIEPTQQMIPMSVNGLTGLVLVEGDQVVAVVSLTVLDGLITRIDLVRAPGKLPHSVSSCGCSPPTT
jgi:RNA polymerase sigma-70 factor, ECF subfamily